MDSTRGRLYRGAVSTPSDPQRGGPQPDPGTGRYGGDQPGRPYDQNPYDQNSYDRNPYGQPPGQSPYGQPGQYGGQPYPGQPYGGQPYGGDQGTYAYNPYGTPYPAGLDDRGVEPVRRPGSMLAALVLLILSALPFLAVGLVLVVALTPETVPAEVLADPRLAGANITPEFAVALFKGIGGVVALLAVLYILFAVLAFRGRNFARIVVAVMTVGFVLMLLVGALGGAAGDAGSLVFLLLVLLAGVAGTVLLFSPAAARFFTAAAR